MDSSASDECGEVGIKEVILTNKGKNEIPKLERF